MKLLGGAALAMAALSLLAAVAGGLLMACPAPAPPGLPTWLAAGAASHAALMICGFLATMIGLERAVAIARPVAFIAPLASAAAAGATIAGHADAASALFLFAATAFVAANVAIARRQPAAHTAMLLAGALAWWVGCVLHAAGSGAPVPWWLAFLVLTIAAERLEMTRLTRRSRSAGAQLWAIAALMVAGAGGVSLPLQAGLAGLALFGASLILLSAWLFTHDIARRTIHTHGLSRYMAVCLLAGYAWLAVAGAGWIGLALGLPARDLALHALGLGFVMSMMMAHAPVILPALTRQRLQFGAAFYAAPAALHASLVVRVGFGFADPLQRGLGAAMNAIALLLFAATLALSLVAWRVNKRRALTLGKS